MEKEYEYKGYKYWVKVEPAMDETTNEAGFIAYINDEKPGALFYGKAVRDQQGNIMFFQSELSALTNANAVKHSELEFK